MITNQLFIHYSYLFPMQDDVQTQQEQQKIGSI